MTLLFNDTDAHTEALYLALLRKRGVAGKLAAMQSLNASLRVLLCSDPINGASPHLIRQTEIRYKIADRLAQAGILPRGVVADPRNASANEENRLLMQPDGIAVTLLVTEALEALNIPYVIGGSFASTAHGVPRATHDSDLVLGLRADQGALLTALVSRLDRAFLVSLDSAVDALARHTAFNAIHLDSLFKVDLFIPRLRLFEQERLARGRPYVMVEDPVRTAVFSSSEDTILAKLEWYRLGNEVSEKQWSDIQGILKLRDGGLDLGYLRRWASTLGVSDLLSRALDDAGSTDAPECT
jgi:hypothetical protein